MGMMCATDGSSSAVSPGWTNAAGPGKLRTQAPYESADGDLVFHQLIVAQTLNRLLHCSFYAKYSTRHSPQTGLTFDEISSAISSLNTTVSICSS